MSEIEHRLADRVPGLVVVGGSAGGIEALLALVRQLPPTFPGAVVVTQHLGRRNVYESRLREVLLRTSALEVDWAEDGARPRAGRIHLTPQDCAVTFRAGGEFEVAVDCERPSRAIDRLFGSAARVWGTRAVGVVLSGLLSDGAAGAQAIHDHGGTVIVQDRTTAGRFDMPDSALRRGIGALVLPAEAIADAVVATLSPGAGDWFRVRAGSAYLASAGAS